MRPRKTTPRAEDEDALAREWGLNDEPPTGPLEGSPGWLMDHGLKSVIAAEKRVRASVESRERRHGRTNWREKARRCYVDRKLDAVSVRDAVNAIHRAIRGCVTKGTVEKFVYRLRKESDNAFP